MTNSPDDSQYAFEKRYPHLHIHSIQSKFIDSSVTPVMYSSDVNISANNIILNYLYDLRIQMYTINQL